MTKKIKEAAQLNRVRLNNIITIDQLKKAIGYSEISTDTASEMLKQVERYRIKSNIADCYMDIFRLEVAYARRFVEKFINLIVAIISHRDIL